jgi:chloride channel protein, CIC family
VSRILTFSLSNFSGMGQVDRNVPTVPAAMRVAELSDRIAQRDAQLTRRQGIPILNEEEKLVVIITRGDVLRTLEQGADGDTTVLDAGSRNLIVTYPDEILQEAVIKMLRSNIGRLPVVDRQDSRRLVGYLGRAGVMATRLKQHEEEYLREQGLRTGSAQISDRTLTCSWVRRITLVPGG